MNRSVPLTLLLLGSACGLSSPVDDLPSVERVVPETIVESATDPATPRPELVDGVLRTETLVIEAREAAFCRARDAACNSNESACCSDSFCSDLISSYGPAVCTPLLHDGDVCFDDVACASGVCDQWECGSCIAVDQDCYENPSACCGDTFCGLSNEFYGRATCQARLLADSFCQGHEQCASGVCQDSRCN